MPAIDVISAYVAKMRAGDRAAAYEYFDDDVVGYIPGRSALSGIRRGKQAVIDYITMVVAHVQGRVELELIDTLVGSEHVALMVCELLGTGDNRIEVRRVNVYRVVADKIVEIRIFEADQYAMDEWSAAIDS